MTSNRKGDQKKRGQKYQNTETFSLTKRQALTPQQKCVQETEVSGLCKKCTGVIEWKIKYGKYKALSVPKRCLLCGMKTVNRAYFALCKECATDGGCCGKCQSTDVIGAFPDTPDAKVREMNYLKEEMRYMKERERRTLIRDMNKDSKSKAATKDTKQPQWNADSSESSESENESLELNIQIVGESHNSDIQGIATNEGLDEL